MGKLKLIIENLWCAFLIFLITSAFLVLLLYSFGYQTSSWTFFCLNVGIAGAAFFKFKNSFRVAPKRTRYVILLMAMLGFVFTSSGVPFIIK